MFPHSSSVCYFSFIKNGFMSLVTQKYMFLDKIEHVVIAAFYTVIALFVLDVSE